MEEDDELQGRLICTFMVRERLRKFLHFICLYKNGKNLGHEKADTDKNGDIFENTWIYDSDEKGKVEDENDHQFGSFWRYMFPNFPPQI